MTAAVKRAINDNCGMLGNPFSTVNLSDCCQREYTPPPPPPTVNSLCKKNGEKDTKLTSLLIVVIKISKDQKIRVFLGAAETIVRKYRRDQIGKYN